MNIEKGKTDQWLGFSDISVDYCYLFSYYFSESYIHISVLRGCMKEKTENSCLSGSLIMIDIPVLMKGFEKSTTRSRARLIVNGATARSASSNSIESSTVMTRV